MKNFVLALVVSALVFAPALRADDDTIPIKQNARVAGESGSLLAPGAVKTEAPVPAGKKPEGVEGQAPQPYIASIDTYGSTRINESNLKELLGPDLQNWLTRGLKGDPKVDELEKQLITKIKAHFDVPVADFSIIQYFEPEDLAIHVTLDVVEKKDVATRMPFMAAPTGDFKDPDGLLKAWQEYEDAALDLVEAGQLEPEADECVAFHCPFGHKHAQLKKYEAIFVNGVKKNADQLLKIQAQDKNPDHRAAATYLLAYLKDGRKVVDSMVSRIHDPDATVRNNALRVLGDIAEFHSELVIPHKLVLEALTYPRVSDRSKALYVLYLLSMNSAQVRDDILKSGVPTLLSLMTCKQPDHQEISHAILRKLSGKEFASSDIRSWENWYLHVQKDRGVSSK